MCLSLVNMYTLKIQIIPIPDSLQKDPAGHNSQEEVPVYTRNHANCS